MAGSILVDMNLLQSPPESGEPSSGDERVSPEENLRVIVADHYQIEGDAPIGSGGMALVYRGRDLRTRRAVALKTLKPEWVADPTARSRFRHEARTMAFLAHPNVARVYDLWEPDDASQPWVVLEYLQGPSLRQELDLHGPMDIDRVAHLLRQIASALDHLHGRGLCHLDVKPQNLLFSEPMIIKLIDFGIAQPTGSSSRIGGIQAFGSPAYISPEQAAGERIGPTSDTYSLGCVVYEMITGTPPFVFSPETDPQIVLAAHLTEEVEPPSERRADLDVPEWIDDIVLDALMRDASRRYPSSSAFADAFRGAMEAEIPPDSTVPLNHLPRFDPRRNPSPVHIEQPKTAVTRHRPPLVTHIRTG
ncbi:MAG TPA: serine/threonine-protein kinase, partial [Thermomicrobiales bacterium]|nr:serine/threonine-protein kinase [Thermomicrobiales bacterium]